MGFQLSETAANNPDGLGVAMPLGRDSNGKRIYRQVTFRELDEDSDRLALGLSEMGIQPGTRLALMIPPSIDFISFVFAMFKAGVVQVLIDPGMGRKNMIRCLQQAEPEGFVGISLVQAVRIAMRGRFRKAKSNVTVGKRWFWGGPTISQFRRLDPRDFVPPKTSADDPAAIIFTTGSTGPPKGVLYSQGNFAHQAQEVRTYYDVQPGEIDLPGFPLFALFNCAMGVSTVIPVMDPTRPADVDPTNIIEAVRDWNVTQSFGSPALWNTVSLYCEKQSVTLPTMRRVLTAGAPVPPHVLDRVKKIIHPDGEIHTPYGATESLPVASNSAAVVLGETAAETDRGAGTCVGTHFPGIQWRIIEISDGPLEHISETTELAPGEIGELIVQGPVVTKQYVTQVEANALHKISDGDRFWHRMGDVGYLDEKDRFWFCGRKSHRVQTERGDMFTIRCEAIFNTHKKIYRSALVGVGEEGRKRPVMICEPWKGEMPESDSGRKQLIAELQELAKMNPLTESISEVLLHLSLPVDIRHNAKIFREKLAPWATEQIG